MIRLILLSVLGALLLQPITFAQSKDIKNSKDHPLFPTRMPGYVITNYIEVGFDGYKFPVGPTRTEYVEGRKVTVTYYIKSGEQRASRIEVERNYKTAFEKIGGTVVYEGKKTITMKKEKAGAEVWVELTAMADARGCHRYILTVLEKGEMMQVISASDMLDALNKDGFIPLDIHFDTGKATIKPESRPIIDQIVALMKGNADLKISVEGHTDNVGDAASNKKLSDERAASVVAAIVEQGIDGSRLSSVGHGLEKPVADNRTEDGRAKNRRVELVKK
ncbi:MAG: OmpA family protein [Bacteroidota bacterium]